MTVLRREIFPLHWCILVLVSLMFVASPALAQGNVTAPAVPGFARFHADEKADAVQGGHLLIKELHCLRCHAVPFAPAGDRDVKTAPILDGVGGRLKSSYIERFLADPQAVKPGTKMPNLFAGVADADKKEQAKALAHFLASTGAPSQLRPDRKGINPGRDLYQKVGCVACHGTRDAKGEQGKLFATSVPLGDVKSKFTLASLKSFLENPHQTRPLGRMPGLLNPKEASDVANYLLQGAIPGAAANNMKFKYYEGSWQNLPDFTKIKPVSSGEAADFELSVARRLNDCALRFEGYLQIEKEGNYTFHTASDDGSKLWIEDKVVVNNDGIHPPQSKSGKIKLAKGTHKVAVAVFNLGGGFELSVDFEGPGTPRQNLGPRIMMASEPAKPAPVVEGKDFFVVEPQLAAKGKELYASMGCANCHQLQNENKRVDAVFINKANAATGCLSGTPKKGIPWYGLSARQIASLRAGVQKLWPEKSEDTKARVKETLTAFNCYGCHDRNKIGGVTEDLNKQFTTVMPEMGDEGRLPPSLNGVGAKLNAAYLKKILEQGSQDRPYMHTRMPKFGTAVSHLVSEFAELDAPEKGPKVVFEDPLSKYRAAGRRMVGPEAFGCIKCHTFAGKKAEGVQGMDLAIMTERLKKEWFHNYMVNPNKYRPGTRMPSSFPEGQTPLGKILDGKAETQIEAIWVYLSDGKAATLPLGMNKQSIPLIPRGEAIIYRNFIQGAGTRAIGVGFPEHAHLAFDANDIRLAMIWQGAFIDAGRHWNGRGEGFQPPSGDSVLHLPTGVSFYVLAKDDEAWPTKSAKDLGYQFKGYRLTEDQRPTFLYTFGDFKIEDTPNAVEEKGNPLIRRTLAIYAENPIDKLYYRAGVADKIEAEKDGWYRINDWRMRIEAGANPMIRKSAGRMELLVPVQFKGNNAKVVQEYQW